MDRKRLRRLNQTFLDALRAGHNIAEYDEHRSWFEGSKKEVKSKVAELEDLFKWAVEAGVISKWIEPGDRDRSTCWDWTSDALASVKQLGVTLADPLGGSPLFANVPNYVTTATAMLKSLSIDLLDDDVCGHFNRVYEEHVRYVVSYREKPVAAIIPLVDWEILKDLEADTDPHVWLELIQEARERLGWPPPTLEEDGK